MNHEANLRCAIAHGWRVLECESTPAEMGPHLTREQVSILRDIESWAHDLIAARPAIKPAPTWRTPTDVRRDLVARSKTRTEPAITRRRRR